VVTRVCDENINRLAEELVRVTRLEQDYLEFARSQRRFLGPQTSSRVTEIGGLFDIWAFEPADKNRKARSASRSAAIVAPRHPGHGLRQDGVDQE